MDTKRRLTGLRAAMEAARVEAMLVSSVPNVTYLSGFTGDDSLALVTPERAYLITDFRYVEQMAQECPGWKVVERNGSLWASVAAVLKRGRIGVLGFESAHLPFANFRRLKEETGRARLKPVEGMVEELREIKDAGEVAAIEAALAIQQKAFQGLKHSIRPGMTEHEVARVLEYRMGRLGAEKPAFESIVAAAERGSLPHARATERVIRQGDALLIDWGARRFFYNSDLTRVLHLGRVSRRFERVYGIVKEAQARAIRLIRPGVRCCDVDAAARDYIASKGFGERFGHSLGHGIGLEVHELPRVNRSSDERVQSGMVFTVEPGIYIPGWGGVRIEDMVLVTDTGVRVLSSCDKDLGKMVL